MAIESIKEQVWNIYLENKKISPPFVARKLKIKIIEAEKLCSWAWEKQADQSHISKLKWIKQNDKPIPKDKVVVTLWNKIYCFCQWDEEDKAFWLCHSPSMNMIWKVPKEREYKFTHWMELELPIE